MAGASAARAAGRPGRAGPARRAGPAHQTRPPGRPPPVDGAARAGPRELLDAILSQERSRSATAEEAPLGQWEVEALVPRADVLPPQLAEAAPGVSARRLSAAALVAMAEAMVAGGALGALGTIGAGGWGARSRGPRARAGGADESVETCAGRLCSCSRAEAPPR